MKNKNSSIPANAGKDRTETKLPEHGDCPFINALIAAGIITIYKEKKTGKSDTQKV